MIAAAKRGDTRSFNQLVSQYQDMVYSVAFRILGDGDAAADASQDTFLSAYRAVAKFKGGSFKAWLLRIATNSCYDQLRVPPDQRTTLVLSDVQGLSYAEIAEVTGASIGTVKSRLSRGRARLRDCLLEQGELLPGRYRLKGEG